MTLQVTARCAAYSEKALYTNLDICAGEVFMDYDNRDNTLCDVTFNLKVVWHSKVRM